MNTKNNKARKKSQEKLINAYIELMEQYDIKDITIKMLIKKAEVNRSTFYNNYQDINDFTRKIIDEINTVLFEQLNEKGLNDISVKQQEYILEFIKEHKKEYSLSYKYNLYDENFISKSIIDKLTEKYSQEVAKYKMIGLFEGCNGIIYHWLKNDCDLDCNSLAQIIYDKCENEIKK